MVGRRTPAPEIAGCILLLYAATFFLAVLRALYMIKPLGSALGRALVHAALVAVCAAVALGLFRRQGYALVSGIVLSLLMLLAALSDFHVPETARVPAGVLGLSGAVLLLAARGEFAPTGRAPGDAGEKRGVTRGPILRYKTALRVKHTGEAGRSVS